jgi:hypothetical protein
LDDCHARWTGGREARYYPHPHTSSTTCAFTRRKGLSSYSRVSDSEFPRVVGAVEIGRYGLYRPRVPSDRKVRGIILDLGGAGHGQCTCGRHGRSAPENLLASPCNLPGREAHPASCPLRIDAPNVYVRAPENPPPGFRHWHPPRKDPPHPASSNWQTDQGQPRLVVHGSSLTARAGSHPSHKSRRPTLTQSCCVLMVYATAQSLVHSRIKRLHYWEGKP